MRRVAATVLLALTAPAHAAPLSRFPRHFLLGVATAAYQYEGGTTGTNWNAWEQAHPDTVEPVGRAVDFYRRYPGDLARARGMGLDAFRLSIEWARIEPASGQIDGRAVKHYLALLNQLRARHLEPIVTLDHFTWPEWLEDQAHAAGAPTAWEYPPSVRRYNLPILVAENGMATENGTPRPDGWTREDHLVQHVAAVQQALAEGIPVLGYCHWSLTDNYEWGSYTPRFGLYAVEARSDPGLRRRPTRAVGVYRTIARHRGVTAALLRRHPGPPSSP